MTSAVRNTLKAATTASRKPRSAGYLFYIVPGLVGFLIVIGIPFVVNVILSFTKWTGLGTPKAAGVDNYTRLIQDGDWHF